MMRLGVDSTPLANPQSGAGRYTFNILRQLDPTAVQITFFGSRPHAAVLKAFPRSSVVVRTGKRIVWYAETLPRLLPNCCDVFWGFPLPLRRVHGVKYVTSILDVYVVHLPRVEEWNWGQRVGTVGQRSLSTWMTARSLRVADQVIALSQSTASDLEKYFGVRASYIAPPGAAVTPLSDTDRRPLESTDCYVLAVGGYEPYRNRKRLVQAFANPAVKGLGKLVIAGRFISESQREQYMQWVEDLGLNGQVVMMSLVTDDMLASLYAGSCGVIHPSLCEGFGIPVIEALGFGKPVAISTAGALPEAAGGLELTRFNPFDVDDIARALVLLFSVGRESDELLASRKQYSQSYQWSDAARVTWDALTHALHPNIDYA